MDKKELALILKEGEGYFIEFKENFSGIEKDFVAFANSSGGKTRFDELTNTKANYPRDFSRKKLNKFLGFAGLSKSLSSEKVLSSLRVIESQGGNIYFNNSGILFFSKEPQKFIPWSVFTVALFKDKEGVDIIDRKEITGGLFEIVEQVMDFTRLYAKVAYRITGKPQRENIYEYSFEAIREAVINSVMHKDYFEHGHSNILKFFPDRIQIENIWLKPKKFILGKTIFRRNQVVADLFSRIHFGEKMGSGMKRMRDICKKENAPYPKIKYTDIHFYIIFRQSREYLKMTKPETKVTEKVTENQRKILEEISKYEHITVKRLSAIVGISERKIKENISKLKQNKLLKRIGPDKGGYWKAL